MRELLLINFDGTQYGVWKDDVVSVKELKNIHRLPLSPACFAGVSVLDGDTVALFDLGACIGFPPMSREQPGHLLLMSKKKQSAGLAVEGDVKHIDVSADAVFPMPNYLKTPAVDTCVVHKGVAVPIINISFIYSKRQKGKWDPPVSDFAVSGKAQAKKQLSAKKVRIFRTSGETFAVPASCIKKVSAAPQVISPLTLTPPYVEGVVFHQGSVIPIISLSQRLKLPHSKAQKTMLCADLAGTEFGFRIDSDEKTLTGKNFTIEPLPPLVQSAGIKSAVLQGNKIAPLIHLPALMSRHQDEKPPAKRYSPRSKFSSVFGKKPVDVREFLLLGMHYCVPNSQVEKVIDLISYRWLPKVEPVVAGVAEHEGELLPVLDLAVWFGRSSIATPDWKMMLVKNGNFRALVLTKAVSKKLSLPTEMHRALPITLPRQYVYGCYPDDTAVKIILNIEAMAVHFDKSAIKDFINIMLGQGIEVPEEAQPEPPEPDAEEPISIQGTEVIHEEPEESRQEIDKPEKTEKAPGKAAFGSFPGNVKRKQKPKKKLKPPPKEEASEEIASPDQDSGVLTADVQPQEASIEPDAAEPQAPDTENVPGEQETDFDGHDIRDAEPEITEVETEGSPPDEFVPEEAPQEAAFEATPGDVTEDREPDEDLEPAPREGTSGDEDVSEEQKTEIDEHDVSGADSLPDESVPKEAPQEAAFEATQGDVTEDREPDEDLEPAPREGTSGDEDVPEEQKTEIDEHDVSGADSLPDESVPEEAPQEAAFETAPRDVTEDRESEEDVESAPDEPVSGETASPDQELDVPTEEEPPDSTPVPPDPEGQEVLGAEEPEAIHEELEESRQEVDKSEKTEESPADDAFGKVSGDPTQEHKPDEDLETAPEEAPQEAAFEGIPEDGTAKDEPVGTGMTEPSEEPSTDEESGVLEDMGEGAQIAVLSAEEGPDLASERRKKQKFAYAAIAALLIVVLYLSGVFVSEKPKPEIDSTVEESSSEMVVTQDTAPVTVPPAQDQTIESTESVTPEEPAPEIDSTVEEGPSEMVVTQDASPVTVPPAPDHISVPMQLQEFPFEVSRVHKVVKGDTLWDICEYYTGNPFNYHIVAVDNEIPNPDFILPGQKIILYQIDEEQDKKRPLP